MHRPNPLRAFLLGILIVTIPDMNSSTDAADPIPPHSSIRFIEPQPQSGSSKATVVRGKALIHTAQIQARGDSLKSEAADSIHRQCESVLTDLESVLRSSGATLANLVKLNVYVTDENGEKTVSEILADRSKGRSGPAISFVQTTLPVKGARLAMDAVAVTDQTHDKVERWIGTSESNQSSDLTSAVVGAGTAAVLPVGPRIYIAGQAEKGDGSLADATRQTMAGLIRTLEHLGLSRHDVVHLKAFLTPMSDANVAIKEMGAAFPGETPPPIALVEWKSSLPIEIELIAAARTKRETTASTESVPGLEFLSLPWMNTSPVYSRVVKVNKPATIYLSGLFGTTTTPNGDDEVRELLRDVGRIAGLVGGDLKHLVKATYYCSTEEVSNRLNTIR
ncbi:MAG: hypothetical protein FJ267_11790, partial [Planctomycetes bacterium]|nr:hypothetical protein [Planctomycetota bacterium]